MSLAKGIGNFLSGKPIFEASDNNNAPNTSPANDGKKVIPEVIVAKTEYHQAGNGFGITVFIHNKSELEIELNSINLLGRSYDLRFVLRPGEMKEFIDVYKGDYLKHGNYKYCELEYKTLAEDTFKTMHNIDYSSKGDGVYHINNIKYLPPVRDIFGDR